MTRDDAQQVLEWTSSRLVCHELDILLEIRQDSADEDGLYAGELNGELVASSVITRIADDLYYRGFLYVVERHRELGFSRRLFNTVNDVQRRRNRSIYCFNAEEDRLPVYEKLNYKPFRKLTRYVGVVSAQVD